MANTGRKIVLTLRKFQNPGNIDTGETKDNVVGDVNYIAPYFDYSACPVVSGTACPVVKYTQNNVAQTLEFEFSLPGATYSNAAVKKIRVTETLSGDIIDFPFVSGTTVNYFHDTFTGLPVGSWGLTVEYLDSVDATIHTCTIIP